MSKREGLLPTTIEIEQLDRLVTRDFLASPAPAEAAAGKLNKDPRGRIPNSSR